LIESYVAEVAGAHTRPEDLVQVQKAVKQMILLSRDFKAFLTWDQQFHDKL